MKFVSTLIETLYFSGQDDLTTPFLSTDGKSVFYFHFLSRECCYKGGDYTGFKLSPHDAK